MIMSTQLPADRDTMTFLQKGSAFTYLPERQASFDSSRNNMTGVLSTAPSWALDRPVPQLLRGGLTRHCLRL